MSDNVVQAYYTPSANLRLGIKNDACRNYPKDKAELFNIYFYHQFSIPFDRYDIDIDWSNDQLNSYSTWILVLKESITCL